MAKSNVAKEVGAIARAHEGVEIGVACEGTAVESTTYKVNGKAFLFVRAKDGGHELRFKLEASAKTAPKEGVEVGLGGWSKLVVAAGTSAPLGALKTWVGESYALTAKGSAKKRSGAKEPAAKKKKSKPALERR